MQELIFTCEFIFSNDEKWRQAGMHRFMVFSSVHIRMFTSDMQKIYAAVRVDVCSGVRGARILHKQLSLKCYLADSSFVI